MRLIKKYDLNDFFNVTFKNLIPVLKKTYLPLLIILVPASLLYGWGIVNFFSYYFDFIFSIMDSANLSSTDMLYTFMPFFAAYGKFMGLMLIVNLGTTLGTIIVIGTMGDLFFPDKAHRGIKELISSSLLKIILAGLLVFVFVLGICLALGIVIALFSALAALFLPELMIFLMVIISIAIYAFLIWLIVSFSFSTLLIIMEDEKVWPSLKRSVGLLRKNWWRFIGISILFSMLLSFASSLITSPLMIFGMLPSFSDFFTSMNSSMDEYEMLFSMLNIFQQDSFAIIMAISMLVSSFASMIFMNIFHFLFYIDLKVRKNELQPDPEEESAQ